MLIAVREGHVLPARTRDAEAQIGYFRAAEADQSAGAASKLTGQI